MNSPKANANGRNGKKTRGRFPARLVLIGLASIVVMFGIGYLVAVRVLFPPLPEPTTGIVVPQLTGLSVADAEARLRSLDLRVTDVVEIAHPTQRRGIIIAQSPLPGQQLRSAGAVRLAISGGKPRVAVPNVIGFTADRATAVLTSMGLQAEQQVEASDRPAGTVIRISPPAGTDLVPPSRVVLVVSSGPPPVVPDTTVPLPADTLAVSASGTTT